MNRDHLLGSPALVGGGMRGIRRARVALLLDSRSDYGRDIIDGIAYFVRSAAVEWDLLLQDYWPSSFDEIKSWEIDAVIADCDRAAIRKVLRQIPCHVVGVGTSYRDPSNYPASIPYVATDNSALIEAALRYFDNRYFASINFYGLPHDLDAPWIAEREDAFNHLVRMQSRLTTLHRGTVPSLGNHAEVINNACEWLRTLPLPAAVIAVDDARAQILLKACVMLGDGHAGQVLVVGIGNERNVSLFGAQPEATVIPDGFAVGHSAAAMLGELIISKELRSRRLLIPPRGLKAEKPGDENQHISAKVRRALHFIRQHATEGIRGECVAEHIGKSRSWLDQKFKQELGRTVRDEIFLQRVAEAQRLLLQGELGIEAVADACGFNSAQYLYKVFAREYGCTPRAWRERMIGSPDCRLQAA